MIHIHPVGKLMHNDIIHQFLREIVQAVIKIQVAFTAAAPPPSFLVSDGYALTGHAHFLCIQCDPFQKMRANPVLLSAAQ